MTLLALPRAQFYHTSSFYALTRFVTSGVLKHHFSTIYSSLFISLFTAIYFRSLVVRANPRIVGIVRIVFIRSISCLQKITKARQINYAFRRKGGFPQIFSPFSIVNLSPLASSCPWLITDYSIDSF